MGSTVPGADACQESLLYADENSRRRGVRMTDTTEDVALGQLAATELNVDNGGLPAGLPMPRDPDLLTDMSRRYRPSTFGPDRYPFPIPNGWFVVADASEIGPGEVRALHYFDRDLVLYRAADGTPRVLDAPC